MCSPSISAWSACTFFGRAELRNSHVHAPPRKNDGAQETSKEVRPEMTNQAQNFIELHRLAAMRYPMLVNRNATLRFTRVATVVS